MQKLLFSGFLLLSCQLNADCEVAKNQSPVECERVEQLSFFEHQEAVKKAFQEETGLSWSNRVNPNNTVSLVFTGVEGKDIVAHYCPEQNEISIANFLSDDAYQEIRLTLDRNPKCNDSVCVEVITPIQTLATKKKIECQKYCKQYYTLLGKFDFAELDRMNWSVMKYDRKSKELEITAPYIPAQTKQITEVAQEAFPRVVRMPVQIIN